MGANKSLMESVGASLGRLGVSKIDGGNAQIDELESKARAVREAAEKAGGGVINTGDHAAGQFMDRKQVHQIVDLTVALHGWLAACSTKVVSQRKGEMPKLNLTEPVTTGTGENADDTTDTTPETSAVNYNCAKFKSVIYISYEAIREAAASGTVDFGSVVLRAFAKRLGYDLADVMLNGDTSLPGTTKRNKLLRQIDGWLKQARENAVYSQTTRGTRYDRRVYPHLYRRLPKEYRRDPDLRFLESPITDMSWEEYLSTLDGSDVRDDALINSPGRTRHGRMGLGSLIIPQFPEDLGFDVLAGSAAAPDSAAASGGGIALNVSTALGGYASAQDGRQVKITYTATGLSETVEVTDTGAILQATTAGTLGQSSVSTTAGDYSVDVADTTPIMLTNPANLLVVMCDKIRAYNEFEKGFERWKVTVFWEGDAGIFNPDALAMQDGVIPTDFSWGN